ncbi:MAG: hypothetical protein KDK08_27500 [Rhizobiaceae bacterium]|nr:hypothetical protein [Rhizobiaceae bacterium]
MKIRNAELRRLAPTPERLSKAAAEVEIAVMDDSEGSYRVFRLTDGSPLESLYSLNKRNQNRGISLIQYQAGCRYYADAYAAGIMASGAPDLEQERVDGGRHKDVSEYRLEAAQRYNAALRSVSRQSAEILQYAVLLEMPLTDWGDARRFPQARERRAIAIDRLTVALDELDRHYLSAARKRGA